MEINKNIPVPLYFQLKELLQQEINKGVYKPGDLIPTELKLMEQYDLSRTTVRQAVNALVSEGYLTRKKGVGTTVLPMQKRDALANIPSQIKESGFVLETRLLSFEEDVARDAAAQRLELDEGEPIYIMARLRLGDGIPLVYSRSFIAQKTAPRLKQNVKSATDGFHKYLAAIGKEIRQIRRTTEAGFTDEKSKEILNLPKNTPIVLLTDLCYSATGQIVEYTISMVNTNVLKLSDTVYLK